MPPLNPFVPITPSAASLGVSLSSWKEIIDPSWETILAAVIRSVFPFVMIFAPLTSVRVFTFNETVFPAPGEPSTRVVWSRVNESLADGAFACAGI